MLAFLQRTGIARGVLGGSRAWSAVAVVAFGLRQLRKLGRPQPRVLTEELRPGEAIVIRHLSRGRR